MRVATQKNKLIYACKLADLSCDLLRAVSGQAMKIQLNPTCLKWARERSSISPAELARRVSVKEEAVNDWEVTGEITLAQAGRLATSTHVPIGNLFLPHPPIDVLPIADFRTVGGEVVGSPSTELLDCINDAVLRQEWYRDYAVTNGAEPLAFVGSVRISDDVIEVAEKIRSVLTWDVSLRSQSRTLDEAFANRVKTVEDAGILAMRNSVVGNNNHRPLLVSEFRGFALSDKYAPLVFVNSRDAKAAQMFTLAHEIVHIWLGNSGVSNENLAHSDDNSVEKFCNGVAAELLVPSIELRDQWAAVRIFRDYIQRLVRYFKVSSLVIIRRLYDLGIIAAELFNRMYVDELGQFKQGAGDETAKGGGNFYYTLRSRLGRRFVSAIVASTLEGSTPFRDAFRLLGVNNAEKVRKLASLTLEAA